MIGRWRHVWGGDEWVPEYALTLFVGWSSWLVGFCLERHTMEWTAQLHLGPVALWLEHVDRVR